MSLREQIFNTIAKLFFERPNLKKSLQQISQEMEATGKTIDENAGSTPKTEQAQKTLRHISGIERWAQRRMRVFLGEEFNNEEYDDYRPSTDLSLDEQREFFRNVRQDTITLIQEFIDADISLTERVKHNDLGPFTVRGWLGYINTHANIEARPLR